VGEVEGDDGDADQALLEAALKASLDAAQPAMDDEVVCMCMCGYIDSLSLARSLALSEWMTRPSCTCLTHAYTCSKYLSAPI
jgi:hypothetical protein